MNEFWSAIVGAIIGGGIAGYFSLRAVKEAHKNDLDLQGKNKEQTVKAFYKAIFDEIDTLWSHYTVDIGSKIEALQTGQPFLWSFLVIQDYFTVYNSNASLLGQINDDDLRRAIVVTYTKAKGLVDSFRFNNDLIQKLDSWEGVYKPNPDLTVHINQQKERYLRGLVQYAVMLKKSHTEVQKEVENLRRLLLKQGVLSGK